MGIVAFISSLSTPVAAPPTEPGVIPVNETEIDFMDGYVEFSGEQLVMSQGASATDIARYYTPRMLYSHGKTFLTYITEDRIRAFGQIRLLEFDKQKGFHRPITVGDTMQKHVLGEIDTHQMPSMIVSEDPADNVPKVYCSQERTHLTPFESYKDVHGDRSLFARHFDIGVNLAYANYIEKIDSNIIIWCRGGFIANTPGNYDNNHLYSIFVVDSTNKYEGLGSATPRRITSLAHPDMWHYPVIPFGYHREGSTYCLAISRRVGFGNNGFPATYHHKYAVVYTDDFVTFRNRKVNATFSHDTSGGLLTDAILFANFQFYATNSANVQGKFPVVGCSSDLRFYAIIGDQTGSGGYVFVYLDEATNDYVVKDLNIPNVQTFAASSPTSAYIYIMAHSRTDIRVVVQVISGVLLRPHTFRTANLGDTWEDTGDMFPEVMDRNVRALIPNNIMQIPKNTNFMIGFTFVPANIEVRSMFCKVAAWGKVQPIPGVPVVAATEMNYNGTGLFDYEFTDEKITRTGTNITALIDNFGLRNATGVNNPQWVSPDSATLVAASQQRFSVSTPSTIVNKNSFTYIDVAKPSGATNVLLSFSLNSASNEFFDIILNPTGQVRVRIQHGAFTVTLISQDLITDSNFHVVAVAIDGRADYRIWVDGKFQFFETNLTDASDLNNWKQIGKSASTVGANVVNLGVRDISTTDLYSTGEHKRKTLFEGVMPAVELQGRIKMLCDLYGIAYQTEIQIPS